MVGRRGALSYEFERAGPRTVLTRSSCTSPWHHFPPSYLDDSGCAYIWLVNPSGGLVGGDHVSVEAQLHAHTHVLMTSPSANRVYRSLSEPAVQEVRVSVGPGARLEWLPEVTIPFAGSRFRQSICVDLAPGATVILWDAMASGRVAKQERWAFASFENEIRITNVSRSIACRTVLHGSWPTARIGRTCWKLGLCGVAVCHRRCGRYRDLETTRSCARRNSGAAPWLGVGSSVHSGSSRFGSQIGRSVCARTYCDVRGDLGGSSERTMGSSGSESSEILSRRDFWLKVI